MQTPIKTLFPALDNALEGVAVRDTESSFMISPLPQFTGVLPSFLDGLTPLPDLTEDVEGEEKEDDEEISTPDSIQNAHDMEGTHDFRRQSSGESLGSRPLDCSRHIIGRDLARFLVVLLALVCLLPSEVPLQVHPPHLRTTSCRQHILGRVPIHTTPVTRMVRRPLDFQMGMLYDRGYMTSSAIHRPPHLYRICHLVKASRLRPAPNVRFLFMPQAPHRPRSVMGYRIPESQSCPL